MRSGGEPLPYQRNDTGIDAGQFGGELKEIDATIGATAGDRIVVPVYAEEIQRVEIPQANIRQAALYYVRNQLRVLLLFECWDNNSALTGPLDGILERFLEV